jgi:trigger factor
MFVREKAIIKTNDSGEIKWSSSDESIVTVDKDGIITAVKKGEATITAENSKGEKLEYKATVISPSDYFVSADYKTIQVKKSEIKAEIEKDFQSMADYYATKQIANREIKKGDVAAIYFVGTLDGETSPFQGGTGAQDLEIGSGMFIEGFEEGLIGYKKGDKVTLNLKFPDNYGAEGSEQAKFNGKAVSFEVSINEVYEYIPAEINDELVAKATNAAYKTVAEYTAYLEEAVLEYLAIEAVIGASEIKGYNDDMLAYYKAVYLQNTYGYYASMYGVSIVEYAKMIGITEEALAKEADENAKPYIEQLYLCYNFYSDGSVTISDEKRNAIVSEYAKANGLEKPEDLLKYISQADIDNYVLIEYALETIVNGVEVIDDTQAE